MQRRVPRFDRRAFVVGLAGFALACNRAPGRGALPTPSLTADFDSWNAEARAIVGDVLATLRVFDTFHAFRVSRAREPADGGRTELAWDPPTWDDWDQATRVARGVRARAEQLFTAVTSASVDPNLWRERRSLAESIRKLMDLGGVLAAYRERVDQLAPGDALESTVRLLDQAWSSWEDVAMRWNISRSEIAACAV